MCSNVESTLDSDNSLFADSDEVVDITADDWLFAFIRFLLDLRTCCRYLVGCDNRLFLVICLIIFSIFSFFVLELLTGNSLLVNCDCNTEILVSCSGGITLVCADC